jgi:hypothetical protein
MTEPTEEEVERIARGLTKAQARELALAITNAAADHATYFFPGYRPGDRLYELGLIEMANARWRGNAYLPTDLGRRVAAALSRAGSEP